LGIEEAKCAQQVLKDGLLLKKNNTYSSVLHRNYALVEDIDN